MEKYDIISYGRFRDDIIIAHKDKKKFKDFFMELSGLSRPIFEVELEALSDTSLPYLSVDVIIGQSRFATQPKPMTMAPMIDPSSAHAGTIHKTWIKGYAFALRQWSSDTNRAKNAVSELRRRLILHQFPTWSLSQLDDKHKPKVGVSSRSSSFRFVFGYHPALERVGIKHEI